MNIVEEIIFSPTLTIWKSHFDINDKNKILNECEKLIKSKPNVNTDGYSYYINGGLNYTNFLDIKIESELDRIMCDGFNSCIQIHNDIFNEIKTDVWINVVRATNPVQKNYKHDGNLIFHNHVDLNIINKLPPPLYTFVCYIQMPNNLLNYDGVLFMEDIDKKVFSILPVEGEIIIMKGDLPHVPNYSPNSTIDRIVLAGSIRMDFSKKTKTLI